MPMDFDSLCDAIIEYISLEKPDPIDRDTPLLEKEIIDSFTIIGLVLLLEEQLSVEIEPDSLATDNFASVATIANWGLSLNPKSR